MSTTNQMEKTNEGTTAKVEVAPPKNVPVERVINEETKPPEPERDEKKTEVNETSADKEKEQRRRRSASAEMELTESQKLTRQEQKKKQKAEKKQQKIEKSKNKKPRLRIFPIWLRLVFVVTLCIAALAMGLMIGYGVLGDGEPKDALQWETWQHIIDIVKKEK